MLPIGRSCYLPLTDSLTAARPEFQISQDALHTSAPVKRSKTNIAGTQADKQTIPPLYVRPGGDSVQCRQ